MSLFAFAIRKHRGKFVALSLSAQRAATERRQDTCVRADPVPCCVFLFKCQASDKVLVILTYTIWPVKLWNTYETQSALLTKIR